MVRDLRIKEDKLSITANSAGHGTAYSTYPINGEILQIKCTGTAPSYDIFLYPSGEVDSEDLLFQYQGSGTKLFYPLASGTNAIVDEPFDYHKGVPPVIKGYLYASGNNLGDSSGLDIRVRYR